MNLKGSTLLRRGLLLNTNSFKKNSIDCNQRQPKQQRQHRFSKTKIGLFTILVSVSFY